MYISNWEQKQIEVGKSNGGVLALADFSDNLLHKNISPWPHPAIIQKLYKSNQSSAFTGINNQIVTKQLGYYSDIQSLHSEDAITWSFFGVLSISDHNNRVDFLNWLVEQLELDWEKSQSYVIELWRRIPHPDTLVPGGPEVDFIIQGDNCVILGEAKWGSDVAQNQGKQKNNKSQLELRVDFLSKYGAKIYGSNYKFVVLYLTLDPVNLNPLNNNVVLKNFTWDKLCQYSNFPLGNEFSAYYNWKLQYKK